MTLPRLGAHMSIAGEPANALRLGQRVGCDTIQMFVRSPNRWQSPPLTREQVATFHQVRAETGIFPVVAHSSYLINLASPEEALWQKSIHAAIEELTRCERLGIRDYVLHPGAHKGAGEVQGLKRLLEGLLTVLEATAPGGVRILLETVSGAGTQLGYRLEHLAWVIEHADGTERLGVCVDTAHLFGAGYNLGDRLGYRSFWLEFETLIGIERLGAIHLNDSRKPLGSRGDRHTHIGEGLIGIEAFARLVNDTRLCHVPMFLETPKGPDFQDDIRNLAVLRSLIKNTG